MGVCPPAAAVQVMQAPAPEVVQAPAQEVVSELATGVLLLLLLLLLAAATQQRMQALRSRRQRLTCSSSAHCSASCCSSGSTAWSPHTCTSLARSPSSARVQAQPLPGSPTICTSSSTATCRQQGARLWVGGVWCGWEGWMPRAAWLRVIA